MVEANRGQRNAPRLASHKTSLAFDCFPFRSGDCTGICGKFRKAKRLDSCSGRQRGIWEGSMQKVSWETTTRNVDLPVEHCLWLFPTHKQQIQYTEQPLEKVLLGLGSKVQASNCVATKRQFFGRKPKHNSRRPLRCIGSIDSAPHMD